MFCPQPAAPPQRIQLPRSSTRLQKPHVYVRIITAIRTESWGAVSYEGQIESPGKVIEIAALPNPAVAIECAGPVGAWQRGKHREIQYILWRFDRARWEWVEICRTQSPDWHWSVYLREAAQEALFPRPGLIDVIKRSRDVSEELMAVIDERLSKETAGVRESTLHLVYERLAGRIAERG